MIRAVALGVVAPSPLDAVEVRAVTRRVRGDGWLWRKKSLFYACNEAGANCTPLLPYSECIERSLRGDCLATRQRFAADGTPETFTARCDVLDAWGVCDANVGPDTPIIRPGGGDGGVITLPTLPLPTGANAAVYAAVGLAGFAGWMLWRAYRV